MNTITGNNICDASLDNAGDDDTNYDASLDDSGNFDAPDATKMPPWMTPVIMTPPNQ
jgi:hypothetical protein